MKRFIRPSLGCLYIRRFADQVDHFIQVLQGNAQPFQDMGALAGLLQLVLAAPADHLQAVVQVDPQGLLQAQHARLAIHQCQHDDAESALHGGMLVQVVQHPSRIGSLGQLDHDAHALAVRFIAQVGNALRRSSRTSSAMRSISEDLLVM